MTQREVGEWRLSVLFLLDVYLSWFECIVAGCYGMFEAPHQGHEVRVIRIYLCWCSLSSSGFFETLFVCVRILTTEI